VYVRAVIQETPGGFNLYRLAHANPCNPNEDKRVLPALRSDTETLNQVRLVLHGDVKAQIG
jgi:hypothetical protein